MDRRAFTGTWIFAAAFVGTIATLALSRTLGSTEARFLLDLVPGHSDVGHPPTLEHEAQWWWAAVAGYMERPARALSVLLVGTLTTALALRLACDRGSRAAVVFISLLAAIPAVREAGCTIGGASAAFAIAAATLLALRVLPGVGPWCATIILTIGFFVLPRLLSDHLPDVEFHVSRLPVESPGWMPPDRGIGAILPGSTFFTHVGLDERWALIPSILAMALLFMSTSLWKAIAPIAVAALAATPIGGADLARDVVVWSIPAAMVTALATASGTTSTAGIRRFAFTSGIVMLLVIAGLDIGAERAEGGSRAGASRIVAALTYVQQIAPPGCVAHVGDGRHVSRYYEAVAHRPAMESFVVPDDVDRLRFVRRAFDAKWPQIILVGSDPELIESLRRRYEVLSPDGTRPAEVTILRFRPS